MLEKSIADYVAEHLVHHTLHFWTISTRGPMRQVSA